MVPSYPILTFQQWGYEQNAEGKKYYTVTYPISYANFSVGAIAQSYGKNTAASTYSTTGFQLISFEETLPTVRWISVGV